MILGDVAIKRALHRGAIVVRPMAPWAVNANSVDLHLAPTLLVYDPDPEWEHGALTTAEECEPDRVVQVDPARGFVLEPGGLYLGATVEWTSSGPYLPVLDGTSGAGRLGISVHQTAGLGDVGFEGHWTLELTAVRPVRVFGGEPLAQIRFFKVAGPIKVPYREKARASYADARDVGPRPKPSRMWRKPRWTGKEDRG